MKAAARAREHESLVSRPRFLFLLTRERFDSHRSEQSVGSRSAIHVRSILKSFRRGSTMRRSQSGVADVKPRRSKGQRDPFF